MQSAASWHEATVVTKLENDLTQADKLSNRALIRCWEIRPN